MASNKRRKRGRKSGPGIKHFQFKNDANLLHLDIYCKTIPIGPVSFFSVEYTVAQTAIVSAVFSPFRALITLEMNTGLGPVTIYENRRFQVEYGPNIKPGDGISRLDISGLIALYEMFLQDDSSYLAIVYRGLLSVLFNAKLRQCYDITFFSAPYYNNGCPKNRTKKERN